MSGMASRSSKKARWNLPSSSTRATRTKWSGPRKSVAAAGWRQEPGAIEQFWACRKPTIFIMRPLSAMPFAPVFVAVFRSDRAGAAQLVDLAGHEAQPFTEHGIRVGAL